MNALLISDLHFTDNPRDVYRWGLFEWLTKAISEHDVRDLFLLGDLCESKDRHPARLVNQVVTFLITLFRQSRLLGIHILRGNHDGIDPNYSYFRFLGKFPSIEFIETPFAREYSGREVLMLPHTTKPAEAWKDIELHSADFIFMHATVKGAVSENGQQLDGIPAGYLNTARHAKIYSGDVHVPQTVKVSGIEVEYVGAPYPVKFGDSFEPRAVLLKDFRKAESLHIPAIQRLMLTVTAADKEIDLRKARKGDQIKVKVRLAPAEYGDWAEIKRRVVEACTQAEVELCGLELEKVAQRIKLRTPATTMTKTKYQTYIDFCNINKIPKDVVQEGGLILTEVDHVESEIRG
jgi:UDP-2,3-diacylglucosamine pyrophosphatase LpxH